MKIAVITGASSGMGRECAKVIDRLIPNIEEFWLIGRSSAELKETAEQLHRPAKTLAMDLRKKKNLYSYESLLLKEAPEIVFLVNAAGFGKLGSVSQIPVKDAGDMADLNMRALTLMTKLSLPYMAAKSRILQFASAAAFLPQPNFAEYAASKSYVLSFSRALNEELGKSGCKVTSVCPGPVHTKFFERAESSGTTAWFKKFFMAEPDKVAYKAVKDSVIGKDISIYGLPMNVLRLCTVLIPHKLIFVLLRIIA